MTRHETLCCLLFYTHSNNRHCSQLSKLSLFKERGAHVSCDGTSRSFYHFSPLSPFSRVPVMALHCFLASIYRQVYALDSSPPACPSRDSSGLQYKVKPQWVGPTELSSYFLEVFPPYPSCAPGPRIAHAGLTPQTHAGFSLLRISFPE